MERPNLTPDQLLGLRAVPLVGLQPNRLRVAMEMTGTKQVDIVNATGLTAAAISDVVNGKYSQLTVETARKFAEFFGCSIEDLFPRREVA